MKVDHRINYDVYYEGLDDDKREAKQVAASPMRALERPRQASERIAERARIHGARKQLNKWPTLKLFENENGKGGAHTVCVQPHCSSAAVTQLTRGPKVG
jgi:hypothetical protein